MANTPAQLPNIDLPGAEYFSLAPNATAALGGRRRYTLNPAAVNIPGGGTGNATASLQIENPFTPTSAIYIHVAFLAVFPQDLAAELTIESAFLGLNTSTSNPTTSLFPVGISASTSLTPLGSTVAVYDRDHLVTWKDLLPFSIAPQANILNLSHSVWFKNNDPTNAHAIQAVSGIIYTRLDGLTE